MQQCDRIHNEIIFDFILDFHTCNIAHTLFMYTTLHVPIACTYMFLSPQTYPKRVRAIKPHKVMADEDSLSFGTGDTIFVIDK